MSDLSDQQFRAVLDLFMTADHDALGKESDRALWKLVDEESLSRGFSDWVEAYHEFEPGEDNE